MKMHLRELIRGRWTQDQSSQTPQAEVCEQPHQTEFDQCSSSGTTIKL